MEIEAQEYQRFMNAYKLGLFGFQRLGQAFYNHFSIYKMSDRPIEDKLWQKGGQESRKLIQEIFDIK